MDRHVFRVTASESSTGTGRSATALLMVYVQDVQDHAPVFEKSTYTASIGEDAPVIINYNNK